ncbi:phospholipase D family protein [Clostridium aminobutyricum]|uniref:Phospholipase D family protein n=1 Tax=Clostridium aminobutyricum TaxID=33953 RepID=A0A939IH16_CLOAM|nr:phospholipase D family protein [Clostridium aminobutyricum]MBN7774340.1 phospholipase D family protein [Clostridium aminobutyricum]
MFYIQDPRIESSFLLNEALLDACRYALYGAGTYAFVSADGIQLLMKNSAFEEFMNEGHYFLLMGTDEITNTKSLKKAEQFCSFYPNLTVRAFVHHTSGSTFHPKFSWFKYEQGGVLVLGSGNLTAKGLRRNTEAFVVQPLDEAEILIIEQKWNEWIESSQHCIKELDDPEVVRKAEQNTKNMFEKIMQVQPYPPTQSIDKGKISGDWVISGKAGRNTITEDEEDAWYSAGESNVLIAEIPIPHERKRNRLISFNMEPTLAKNFFDRELDSEYPVVLRQVTEKGDLKEVETAVVRLNSGGKYQIELGGTYVRKFYEENRMIGVFVKLSVRTFLYMMVTPDSPYYQALKEELNNYRWDMNHLVHYETDAGTLQSMVRSLPVLEYNRM